MKTDFTSQTNSTLLHAAEGSYFQPDRKMKRKMNMKPKLIFAGVAMAALLMVGGVGTCYGGIGFYYNYNDPYTGPYYGPYGPYDSGSVIITGGSYRGYDGVHHFFGNGFGHGGHHGDFRGRGRNYRDHR
jgi:hypothetical protein